MFGITTLYSFSQFLFSVTDSILDMVIDTRLKKKKKAPQTIIWFKQLWKSESNFGLYIKNFKTRCENTKLITNREKINKHTEVHK